MRTIAEKKVTIIAGDTGSGKSTQVPKFLLEDFRRRGERAKILVTQPRRVAALSLAERVAIEMGEGKVGGSVGYQVRANSRLPNASRKQAVTFVTLQMIFRYMAGEDGLAGVTHLILDEVHERETYLDVLLGMLKKMQGKGEMTFKLILMSATINTGESYISSLLGENENSSS